jgi:hypothetical protein
MFYGKRRLPFGPELKDKGGECFPIPKTGGPSGPTDFPTDPSDGGSEPDSSEDTSNRDWLWSWL